jgi:hypothetical protein
MRHIYGPSPGAFSMITGYFPLRPAAFRVIVGTLPLRPAAFP